MQLHQDEGETHCANIRTEENRNATGAIVKYSEQCKVARDAKCLISLPLSVAACYLVRSIEALSDRKCYLVRSIEAASDRKSVEKCSTNARCNYHV
jgi:hypothetical protein